MKSWTRWTLGAAIAAMVAIAAYFPTGADLGAVVNHAASWVNPPRDRILIGSGNRYRREEQARLRRERKRPDATAIVAGGAVAHAIAASRVVPTDDDL